MIALTTEEALAYTESLAISGVDEPTVLIWHESHSAAALGISQKAERELNLQAIEHDKVRIVRRQSGGGAVILNPDVLCFEVIAPLAADTDTLTIRESFTRYTEPLVAVLQNQGLAADVSGISDITVSCNGSARKIAGCAQLRKKSALVVHASILVTLEPELLEKYLNFPSDVPDYRHGRSHRDFCITLADLIPEINPLTLSKLLNAEFSRRNWKIIQPPLQFTELASELLNKKYRSSSWNIERTRPIIKF